MAIATFPLRRAAAADAPAMWDVRCDAIRRTCRSHYPAELLERWASTPLPETFGQRIQDEYVVVGTRASRIVGFASLKASEELVEAVFVSPDAGRRGLGRQLLAELEEVAVKLGLQTLRVNASLNAAPFYAAAGYEVLCEDIYTTSAGVEIACVRMKKSLAGRIRFVRGSPDGARGNPGRDHASMETSMNYTAINFRQKFSLFSEQWQPKVIAEMNDYQFKLVRLEGDFIWHDHQHTDETFIVLEGKLRIDFRDGAVDLEAGEMFVIPKGVEHKPFAEGEVKLMLIEPRGVTNTGGEASERTARNDVWV